VPAPVAAGYGSEADWNKFFLAINTCTQQTEDSLLSGAGDIAASGT